MSKEEIKTDKDKLIEEMNQLSNNFEKNKERMVEIAKILLTDHYGYLPRKHKTQCQIQFTKPTSDANDAEKK